MVSMASMGSVSSTVCRLVWVRCGWCVCVAWNMVCMASMGGMVSVVCMVRMMGSMVNMARMLYGSNGVYD
ncbi:hypothetical protein EON63_00465 [archaeon]|nr:MAG: hypothetical protein EON63_00465 [archaeon]